MPEPTRAFLEMAREAGIEFDEGDLARLDLFLALMLDENTRQNLTAIREPGEAWVRHVFDALTLLGPLAEVGEGGRVMDVGSGCGVPGIPLAICRPDLRFTLLEATQKKAGFLERCVRQLNLENVEVVSARAEAAGHDRGKGGGGEGRREAYDAVVARAVGPTSVVAELTAAFAKVGSPVLLIKGQRAGEELAEAARALEALRLEHTGTLETPTGRIVVLLKADRTPKTYPRRDGEPKRSPLGSRRGGGSAGDRARGGAGGEGA